MTGWLVARFPHLVEPRDLKAAKLIASFRAMGPAVTITEEKIDG